MAGPMDANVRTSTWVNLADARLGTKVLWANDEFFAEKENLIKPGRGIFIPDKYTDVGKWMDGWESKRRRVPGNDACILRLGAAGKIEELDIDTNHFLGNHPPFASVEVCYSASDPDNNVDWQPLLPKSPLQPGSQNFFTVPTPKLATHVRLQIYPDGGVARFRVYGRAVLDVERVAGKEIDLVAAANGGRVAGCNDMFFGSKDNLIMPGRGVNMGDGWETRRRRVPGYDWCVVECATRGRIHKVEIDTAHFKGNYPDRAAIWACDAKGRDPLKLQDEEWKVMLPETKLSADTQHFFDKELQDVGPVSHVRLNIYPDGGISRMRCWGIVAP